MSLQVWLPMTQNLENYAISNITFTNTGATYSSSGGHKSGCYSFNGSSNYIQSSTNFSLEGDPSYSIAFWFYWNGSSWQNDYVGVAGFGTMTTLNGAFACLHNGYPDLDFWNQRYKANNQLAVQTWYHLAFVKTAGSQGSGHIYVNGSEVNGTTTNVNAIPNIISNKIIIGRLNDSATRYFNGKLNDVRIYNHALTAAEVQNLYHGSDTGIYVKVNDTIKQASIIYIKINGAWKPINLEGRSVNFLNGDL